jgi:hypothetical protein
LIGYLSSVEKERDDAVTRVESAPFRWLDLPDRKDQTQDTANYNANIKDAPFVTLKPKKTPDVNQSMLGNLDASRQTVRRIYTDKSGKKVVLSRKLAGEA